MRALVVGYGSIGQRHTRVLSQLGCETAVVSRRLVDHPKPFNSLERALEKHRPDYVVVASRTSEHGPDLASLASAGFDGSVLVEKPILDRGGEVPDNDFADLRVGYNLRFHPVITRLIEELKDRRILSVQLYVGQYLPEWRPGRDYRSSYSASAVDGGALLDLSHDLDYLLQITGNWIGLAARGGHFSCLEITSDDVFGLLLETQRCPTALAQVNYLDRVGRREVVVNCDDETISADLIRGELWFGRQPQLQVEVARDQTYEMMHRAMISADSDRACSVSEALAVLRLVEAARVSSEERTWIEQ